MASKCAGWSLERCGAMKKKMGWEKKKPLSALCSGFEYIRKEAGLLPGGSLSSRGI